MNPKGQPTLWAKPLERLPCGGNTELRFGPGKTWWQVPEGTVPSSGHALDGCSHQSVHDDAKVTQSRFKFQSTMNHSHPSSPTIHTPNFHLTHHTHNDSLFEQQKGDYSKIHLVREKIFMGRVRFSSFIFKQLSALDFRTCTCCENLALELKLTNYSLANSAWTGRRGGD